ncbi:MAG TPA: hypothetical protein VEK79_26085 [Thermoanaerobaculia bacterium]|nr:hypothetical protein [Thermoanaerobaculia bacterium]
MKKHGILLLAGLMALTISLGADELRLTVDAEARDIVAGFPIVLDVTLSTTGDATQLPVISPGAGNVHVYIEDLRSGVKQRYLGPQWGIDERAPELYAVTPDAPMRVAVPLLFHTVIEGRDDLAAAVLPFIPARYRLTVQYLDAGAAIPLSGSVDVVIREPDTRSERSYWDAMRADPYLAASIQIGNFARHADLLARAEELVREHPDGAHATVTGLAIGAHALHVQRDARKAEAILQRASELDANALLRSRIRYELASAQIALEKFEEAAATIESALSSALDQGLSRDLLHLRGVLRRGALP